jgi:hypothetical protein
MKDGLRAFFAFVEEDRGQWQVLYDETLPAGGEIARKVGAYRDRLTDMAAGAVRDLSSASDPAADEAIAHALLGAAESLVRWWLHTDAMPSAAVAELLIATVEPGLARRARGAAR